MWRKHLYQSIRCRASVVRMSGLPYSLLFWGAGALCSLVCWRANWARKCTAQSLYPSKKSICILILNSYFKKLSNLRGSRLWTLIDSKNTGKFPVHFPLLSSNINFNCKFSIELQSDSDVKICHLSLQEACQLGKITSVNVSAKHFFLLSLACSHLSAWMLPDKALVWTAIIFYSKQINTVS